MGIKQAVKSHIYGLFLTQIVTNFRVPQLRPMPYKQGVACSSQAPPIWGSPVAVGVWSAGRWSRSIAKRADGSLVEAVVGSTGGRSRRVGVGLVPLDASLADGDDVGTVIGVAVLLNVVAVCAIHLEREILLGRMRASPARRCTTSPTANATRRLVVSRKQRLNPDLRLVP